MKDEQDNIPLVDSVAIVAQVYILPAALKTLKHESVDIKALWSQGIYRHLLLYIVDNTGRHDNDFGRDGLINYLNFLSDEHLNESF